MGITIKKKAAAPAETKKAAETTKQAVSAQTTVEHKHMGKTMAEESTTDKVEVPNEVTGSPAAQQETMFRVDYAVKYTKNLGDYNSISISCGLSVPCQPGEINEAHDFAASWVDEKIGAKLAELEG